jgi:glutathione S-transferase/GST-like protein
MKYLDQWLCPSFSMIGWSIFIGPQVRARDPEELKAAIDRIPLPERRVAWRKAIYGLFGEEELAESRRRVDLGIAMLEAELGRRDYLGSNRYSLADINCFNSAYGLPSMQPDDVNDGKTPNIMRWLRSVARRPAVKQTWTYSRVPRFAERIIPLIEEAA